MNVDYDREITNLPEALAEGTARRAAMNDERPAVEPPCIIGQAFRKS